MTWRGACLCGAVAFVCAGRAVAAHECHCGQCRRWSGHVWGYVTLPWASVDFLRQDGLRWYRHTVKAQRGFCVECGASLFWRADAEDSVDVSAGALEAPTGLRLGAPSHADDRGDYCAPGWLA